MSSTHQITITAIHNPSHRRVEGRTQAEREQRTRMRMALREVDIHQLSIQDIATGGVLPPDFWALAGATRPADRPVAWRRLKLYTRGERPAWSVLHLDGGGGLTMCGLRIPGTGTHEVRLSGFSPAGRCQVCRAKGAPRV